MKMFVRRTVLISLLSYEAKAFLNFPSGKKTTCDNPRCLRTWTLAADNSNDRVPEEDVIVLEVDEDDEESRTYEDFHEKFTRLLKEKSYSANIGIEAQSLFDEMFEAYVISEHPSLLPNTTIYNLLLKAHARSTSPEAGIEAEKILDRMEDMESELVAHPDKTSYVNVIDAWAGRKDPIKAQAVMDKLRKHFEDSADTNFEPDTSAYNGLIKAWMESNSPDKADKAGNILRSMIERYKKENKNSFLPDQKSFIRVMTCYGSLRTKDGLDKVLQLFQTMKELYHSSQSRKVQPNTQVYNELIYNIGINKDIEDRAAQGEKFLFEMLEAANAGNDALEPNAKTFQLIFLCHKGNTDPGVAYKVEKLLELQESYGIISSSGSYTRAIEAIARTNASNKASMCWNLLQKMKEENLKPNRFTYNSVLNACAYTYEHENPAEVFSIAVETFNQIRSEKDEDPDVWTFSNFLRCCSNLVPKNSKRDSVVQNIFIECSKNGQVGKAVLAELLNAGSQETVTKLLGGDPRNGVNIPQKWSRNVKDKAQLLK